MDINIVVLINLLKGSLIWQKKIIRNRCIQFLIDSTCRTTYKKCMTWKAHAIISAVYWIFDLLFFCALLIEIIRNLMNIKSTHFVSK